MKLSRFYSNFDRLLPAVDFNPGMNVVVAEIRLPDVKEEDTHNLGKTTLGALLDFGLLRRRDKNMFLFKYPNKFDRFVFYLEIQLRPGSFLTIRRSVAEASKVSFKRHSEHGQDFTELSDADWDHDHVPFDRSRELLDGYLNLTAVRPWGYRKGLGYLIRMQKDYTDVFQLAHFASAHSDWKPYIAHILGFNADAMSNYYNEEDGLAKLKLKERTIQSELGGTIEDISKIEGLLLLRHADAEKRQKELDSFDFREEDAAQTRHVVDEIDENIAALNAERYALSFDRKKVTGALEEGALLFNTKDAAELFAEVGVFFEGQLRKDFDQLLDFNQSITDERHRYLEMELEAIENSLAETNRSLFQLGEQRAASLLFLSDADVFGKYKTISKQLIELRADILSLTNQRAHLHSLQSLRREIRESTERLAHLQSLVEEDVESRNDSSAEGTYTTIRLLFNDIVRRVIDRNALVTVRLNHEHHPEFEAEILNDVGTVTGADQGNTYKKLLCIAFDLAIIRAHQGQGYPDFVFHDGAFETLDPRKKANLLAVMREYSDLGIQQIITLIDADMPPDVAGKPPFLDSEVVLRLHDEGEDGRLFKMDSW